ncbi:MAG: hypothetical protein F6J97_20720 [Leptolyngbya sp. SIO4C1]|nr:hypothetical protein [Leptolyngbya sp. SIO4C1]
MVFDQFQALEYVCYVLAVLLVIYLEKECHQQSAVATVPVQTIANSDQLPPAEQVVDGLITTIDDAQTVATAPVETPLYDFPVSSDSANTADDDEAEQLEPFEVDACRSLANACIAAAEASNPSDAQPLDEKPGVSLAGVRIYKLHSQAVVRIADLNFDVPEDIRRYQLRGQSVVHVATLEERFNLS